MLKEIDSDINKNWTSITLKKAFNSMNIVQINWRMKKASQMKMIISKIISHQKRIKRNIKKIKALLKECNIAKKDSKVTPISDFTQTHKIQLHKKILLVTIKTSKSRTILIFVAIAQVFHNFLWVAALKEKLVKYREENQNDFSLNL